MNREEIKKAVEETKLTVSREGKTRWESMNLEDLINSQKANYEMFMEHGTEGFERAYYEISNEIMKRVVERNFEKKVETEKVETVAKQPKVEVVENEDSDIEIEPTLLIDVINELTSGDFEVKNKRIKEAVNCQKVVKIEKRFLEKQNAYMYYLVTNSVYKVDQAKFVRYYRVMPNPKTGGYRILGE